jgi:hypothetical protein
MSLTAWFWLILNVVLIAGVVHQIRRFRALGWFVVPTPPRDVEPAQAASLPEEDHA